MKVLWQEESRLSNRSAFKWRYTVNTGQFSERVLKKNIFSSFQKQFFREDFLSCQFSDCLKFSSNLQMYWSSSVSPTQYQQLFLFLGQNYLGSIKREFSQNTIGGRVFFYCIWNILLSFSFIFSACDRSLQLERTQNQFQCRCK